MPVFGLGVDFGTSHTVAVLSRSDGGAAPLLFDGSPVMPSSVYADADASLLTGRDAVNAARIDPARFEPHPKRRIDDGCVLLGDNEIDVVDLFAAVLSRVGSEARRVAGQMPESVSLTHPAAWGPTRRYVLETAAQRAGFASVELVPEPVAAAAYFTRVLRHRVSVGNAVVVYDLGGGTFDASVVARTATGFEVLAVDGLADLGGVDVDHALITYLHARFTDEPAWQRLISPHDSVDRAAQRVLYEDVRMAKEALSRTVQTQFPIPLLNAATHVTRDELEALTRPLLERAITVTKAVMHASKLSNDRIAGVFLVGGASRMPLAATMLHHATGHAPTVIEQPELVVAQGIIADSGSLDEPLTPPAGVSTDDLTPPPIPVEADTEVTPAEFTPPPAISDDEPRSRRLALIVGVVVLLVGGLGVWLLTSGASDRGSNPSQSESQSSQSQAEEQDSTSESDTSEPTEDVAETTEDIAQIEPDLKDNKDFFPGGQLKGFASAWYDDVSECEEFEDYVFLCQLDDPQDPEWNSLSLFNMDRYDSDHESERERRRQEDYGNALVEEVGNDDAGYILKKSGKEVTLHYWDSRYPNLWGMINIKGDDTETLKSLYQNHKP